MQWLVMDARPNDSLFFHCVFSLFKLVQKAIDYYLDSGHGGQTEDLDGDEEDGYDEGLSQLPESPCRPFCSQEMFLPVIYPVDFKKAGHIVNDVSRGQFVLPHLLIYAQIVHDIMVKPLPSGCRLTAIFDASWAFTYH